MTIAYDCTECGRRVQAPDELAGQKARCPFCQAVISVPGGQILEAEEVARPAPELERWPAPVPMQPSTEREEPERRRPCPMCGEMILAEAVKCRFCGEVFDETLRRASKIANEEEAAAETMPT